MKTRTKTKEVKEYYDKCDKCGKEISGTTENQVAFNLGVHKSSKECKKNEK